MPPPPSEDEPYKVPDDELPRTSGANRKGELKILVAMVALILLIVAYEQYIFTVYDIGGLDLLEDTEEMIRKSAARDLSLYMLTHVLIIGIFFLLLLMMRGYRIV